MLCAQHLAVPQLETCVLFIVNIVFSEISICTSSSTAILREVRSQQYLCRALYYLLLKPTYSIAMKILLWSEFHQMLLAVGGKEKESWTFSERTSTFLHQYQVDIRKQDVQRITSQSIYIPFEECRDYPFIFNKIYYRIEESNALFSPYCKCIYAKPVWIPARMVIVLGAMSGLTTAPQAAFRSNAILQISAACLKYAMKRIGIVRMLVQL